MHLLPKAGAGFLRDGKRWEEKPTYRCHDADLFHWLEVRNGISCLPTAYPIAVGALCYC